MDFYTYDARTAARSSEIKMLSSHSIAIPIAIAGAAAMAYLVYRIAVHRSMHRARRDRRDLHREVGKEREALRSTVEGLPEQLEAAKRSRIAAGKIRGPSGREAMQHWLSEFEADLLEAKLLGSQLPEAEAEDMDHSGMELDIKLAEILALSIRANRLADKYRRAAAEPAPSADAAEAQTASIPAQVRAQHAAMSFIAPS
jgi:hypothetical protein